MAWVAESAKRQAALIEAPGAENPNDGSPTKRIRTEQVEPLVLPRSPLAATPPPASAVAVVRSPPSPAQPKGSASPPAYPQRGQPAQTPQQPLPTIPEVHEEPDPSSWPLFVRSYSAPAAQQMALEQLPEAPPTKRRQSSTRRRRQQDTAISPHVPPEPGQDLVLDPATSDEEGPRRPPRRKLPADGHSDTDAAPVDAPTVRRRRVGSVLERRWCAPLALVPAQPAAAAAVEQEEPSCSSPMVQHTHEDALQCGCSVCEPSLMQPMEPEDPELLQQFLRAHQAMQLRMQPHSMTDRLLPPLPMLPAAASAVSCGSEYMED